MNTPIWIALLRSLIKGFTVALIPTIAIVLVVAITSGRVKADEPLTVNLGGISYHMNSEDTNTWFHRGAVFQRGKWLGGYLKNSYGNDSFVAAYKVYEVRSSTLHTEVSMGAVRGYDKCYGTFSKAQKARGKEKTPACFIPIVTVTILTDTLIQPQVNWWGDAIVLTGKYTF